MARAIPGFLGTVPAHDAIQVGADSRPLVNSAAIVAIDGDLSTAATHDCSLAGLDRSDVVELAFREVVLELLGNIDVFSDILGSSAKLDARWIIKSGPLVLATLDELIENDAGDGAVGHTISRVASRDPDVLIAAGIFSDVGHV